MNITIYLNAVTIQDLDCDLSQLLKALLAMATLEIAYEFLHLHQQNTTLHEM